MAIYFEFSRFFIISHFLEIPIFGIVTKLGKYVIRTIFFGLAVGVSFFVSASSVVVTKKRNTTNDRHPPPYLVPQHPLDYLFTKFFLDFFYFFSANLSKNIPFQILFSCCNSLNLKRKCVEIQVSGFWSA